MTWSSSFLISIRFKPWKFSKSCCPLVSIFSTISFFIFHFLPNRRGFFIANIGNLRISLSTISASFPLTFVIGSVKFSLYKRFSTKKLSLFFGFTISLRSFFFSDVAPYMKTNLFNLFTNDFLNTLL